MKGTHLGEFEELILLLVAVLFDGAYGVAIQKELFLQSGRKATISTVHSALHRLENKGYLKSHYGESSPVRGGRRKRLFHMTCAGEIALKKSKEMRNKLWNSIPEIAFNHI